MLIASKEEMIDLLKDAFTDRTNLSMKRHLLTTPLAAGLLLLSTLGCSKKDEPTPIPTGGYTVDGRTVKCTATCTQTATSAGTHLLVVTLTTSPQPASGPETLALTFVKPVSDPMQNYAAGPFQWSTTTVHGPITGIYVGNTATLSITSSGGISGSFASSTLPSISPITAGYFTEVQP
ncbi:MAG: hypothetical protein EOO60_08265 [Hymenobacter sp.]|nr:MAG: hypothetical protein EOO60_08265 [Hymenobacter sp.]